ncbi:MAG: DUF427 domain-containing protein [Rhodococcus sp.]|nr:DUF427 domain-containing protein [Rhodococcus sp. (in: high G+C Gram-positive bacteria)]
MAVLMQNYLSMVADRLRYQPTPKRVRADSDGTTVADSTGAILVWQPGSPVPEYAFPIDDVQLSRIGDLATTVADEDLAGFVILDAAAFTWREEDDEVIGHPRDPFHRVDVVHSARRVTLRSGETVVADSHRSEMLFETGFAGPRHYLPRGDVAVELRPSDTRTVCPYKGEATYWSAVIGDHVLTDIAWSYEHPLPEAVRIRSLLAFHDERLG